MHIVIDARLYGPTGKGIGRYIERLIEHLEGQDTENRYSVLLSRENFHLFNPRTPQGCTRWEKVLVPVRWYSLREQWVVPRVLWRLKPDLVHFPHFNVPLLYRGPFVVTIHDLILLKYPSRKGSMLNAVGYWLKYLGYRLVLRHAINHARQIITVSRTVADEIKKLLVTRYPLPVTVTYEASDDVEAGQLKMPESGWLEKRGITHPYFLYVGNAYPHKNLDFLISWFLSWNKNKEVSFPLGNETSSSTDPKSDCHPEPGEGSNRSVSQLPHFHLVLVGTEDYFYKRLKQKVFDEVSFEVSFLNFRLGNSSAAHTGATEPQRSGGISGAARGGLPILFFGYASESELADLYRNATLVLYPSLDEGFGLPPLEAMRYSVPVVVSDIPVLREILGDAATYFNPRDPTSLTHAVESLLVSEPGRGATVSDGGLTSANETKCVTSCLPAFGGSPAKDLPPRETGNETSSSTDPKSDCHPEPGEGSNRSVSQFLSFSVSRFNKIAAGLIQVQKYSWRRMAEETLAIYHNVGLKLEIRK